MCRTSEVYLNGCRLVPIAGQALNVTVHPFASNRMQHNCEPSRMPRGRVCGSLHLISWIVDRDPLSTSLSIENREQSEQKLAHNLCPSQMVNLDLTSDKKDREELINYPWITHWQSYEMMRPVGELDSPRASISSSRRVK